MNLLESFAKKNDGHYTQESIKEAYSPIGKLIYQPKSAFFKIGESKISVNLNEVGGAIPTAEPFRITLHLDNKCGNIFDIYPVSFWERILQNISTNKIIKDEYVFKGDKELIKKITDEDSILNNLKKEKIYIRIPKENTSKIILTPERGIDTEAQFEGFISILINIEKIIKTLNV